MQNRGAAPSATRDLAEYGQLNPGSGSLSFTGTSGASGSSWLTREANRVVLNFYVTLGSGAAAVNSKIFQLPTGFRPTTTNPQGRPFTASIGDSSGAIIGQCSLEVYSDGYCYVKWVSTTIPANGGIYGSIAFEIGT